MLRGAALGTPSGRYRLFKTTTDLSLQVVVPNSVSAGQAASFSSYGPALDLSFKPDLAAPGNLIVSTPTLTLTPALAMMLTLTSAQTLPEP